MGYIYKITTTQSNKVYIGQTTNSLEYRFAEHKKNAKLGIKYHLYNAIRKYGEDTFNIELIEQCDNQDLDNREKYWISYYNSYNNGYNMTIGGEGNRIYDDEEIVELYKKLGTQRKVSEVLGCHVSTVKKACRAHNVKVGNGLTEEYWNSEQGLARRERMREMGKASAGRVVSEETRKKQSLARKGKIPSNAKPVRCIETGKIYPSSAHAARDIGLKNNSGILQCCKSLQKTAGKYHWEWC